MLELRHLSAGYGGRAVIHDLSFAMTAGELTVLLGPNGCGKSTLLKALVGIAGASGEVRLDGEELLTLPPRLRARRLTCLAQSHTAADITVERLVLHGRFPYLSYPRRYRAEDYAAAERAMEEMGILELASAPLAELSGGQRQKAYIAMALAQDTPVLLMDEPTTWLDAAHQLQLLRLAKTLARANRHVLLVLHDVPRALETADRLILMDKGRIRQQGSAEELFVSGALDEVFSVKISRFPGENGWRYFMDEA
ncbi:MAG: ABC transporter ATP-binding protein [Ruminococcaceae bacterium]|nr:ABC transporter ATP-binding protein [Oscillospiraceae bacterium]